MSRTKGAALSELASLASRAKRLTAVRSVDGWDELSASATSLLSRFQAASFEDLANKAWFILNTCQSIAKFIQSFNEIKVGKFYDAWCKLERVEIEISNLFQNPFYKLSDFGLYELRQVVTDWQSLYPYAVFFSPEMIIKRKECSVCRQDVHPWSLCTHRAGRVYGGSLCYRIVKDLAIVSISLVRDPGQKYSVPFITNEDRQTVDHYDYSIVQFLIERLSSPFDRWTFERTKAYHPHELFREDSPTGPCPCNSGETYENCCLRRPGVIRPHIQISFENASPAELSNAYIAGYKNRNGVARLVGR
jgi:hypothetical protein